VSGDIVDAVEAVTGELVTASPNVVAGLDEAAARRLTDEIREHLTLGFAKLAIARERRADVALGYTTWWEYVDTEFGDLRYLGLPPEERRHVVASMRADSKMSQRAIADRLDVAVGTINNDLRVTGVVVDAVQGEDGKTYATPKRERQPEWVPHEGMSKRDEVVERIRRRGELGLTCRELEIATGWHHGMASSPLSAVARQGRVQATGERRLGYAVYVVPGAV
jgi:hypothetical protein